MSESVLIIGSEGLIGNRLYNRIKNRYKVFRTDLQNLDQRDYVSADLTNEHSWSKLPPQFLNANHFINCAYPKDKNYGKNAIEAKLPDIMRNLNLLVLSNLSLLKYLSEKFLRDRKSVNVVNIGSLYGHVLPKFDIYEGQSFSMPIEYGIAKSSLNYMNRYFLKLVNDSRFKVNSVSPGGIFDNHTQEFVDKYSKYSLQDNMMGVKKIISVIEFLISKNSDGIIGQDLLIDDGFSLF